MNILMKYMTFMDINCFLFGEKMNVINLSDKTLGLKGIIGCMVFYIW